MTKSFSHRIAAISMALLMLVSSTGFAIDVHYCQDQIKGISLIGEAKSCHEKQETPPCHHKKDSASKVENKNCCHNETVVIEKSDWDATTTQIATVQDIQLDFVAAFVAVYILNYNVQADYQPYAQYKSPLPDSDIQVLYQTFLI